MLRFSWHSRGDPKLCGSMWRLLARWGEYGASYLVLLGCASTPVRVSKAVPDLANAYYLANTNSQTRRTRVIRRDQVLAAELATKDFFINDLLAARLGVWKCEDFI
jgi:hypothetical protein